MRKVEIKRGCTELREGLEQEAMNLVTKNGDNEMNILNAEAATKYSTPDTAHAVPHLLPTITEPIP
jgi:hypothetical protein